MSDGCMQFLNFKTSDMYNLNQIVQTPHGKAKIIAVDKIGKAVRVKHLEAITPITDYRFSDLKTKLD